MSVIREELLKLEVKLQHVKIKGKKCINSALLDGLKCAANVCT